MSATGWWRTGTTSLFALGLLVTTLAWAQARDLRLVVGTHLLARPAMREGQGGGEPVRVVLDGARTCDATIGAEETFAAADLEGSAHEALGAPLRGCTALASGPALFAIVHPPPASTWPRAIDADDPRGTSAIELAREAAASAGHLRGEVVWEPERLYEVGGAIYALVSGPCARGETEHCDASVAALARVRGGGAPEVVIARPAHSLWARDAHAGARFGWLGITDVDGDGVVELLETERGDGVFMLRLVRPGRRPEGEVVWTASYEVDPTSASVDRAPRPVAR